MRACKEIKVRRKKSSNKNKNKKVWHLSANVLASVFRSGIQAFSSVFFLFVHTRKYWSVKVPRWGIVHIYQCGVTKGTATAFYWFPFRLVRLGFFDGNATSVTGGERQLHFLLFTLEREGPAPRTFTAAVMAETIKRWKIFQHECVQ